MASKELKWLCFMWFSLLSGHALGALVVPEDQSVEKQMQERSISFGDVIVNSLASINKSHSEMDATNSDYITEWAVLKASKGHYWVIIATLNVWDVVTTKGNQVSASSVSIVSKDGGPEQYNIIMAGWHVYADLYGDKNPHFFTYWKVGEKGCYNLLCEGFVLTDNTKKYFPGQYIKPPHSTYEGVQLEIEVYIVRKAANGHWWLHVNDHEVGYWPKDLFMTLAGDATDMYVGGYVIYAKGDPSPPMGSGHFASEGQNKSAYLVARIWDDARLYPLCGTPDANREDCYPIAKDGIVYYYGGPGGCNAN